MTKLLDLNSKNNREKHNRELIERMKSGESLQRYTAQSSWFPPRPVIKKDLSAIEMLYGGKKNREDIHSNSSTKKPSFT